MKKLILILFIFSLIIVKTTFWNFEIIKDTVYTPVYTISWDVLSWTQKIGVIFSNGTKKDTYFLNKYIDWDKQFIANIRLDYWNIDKGINNYTLNFYDRENNIIWTKSYQVEAKYDEVKVWNKIIYIDKNEYEWDDISKTTRWCYDYHKNKDTKAFSEWTYLVKQNNQYSFLPSCMTFSTKLGNILTYKKSNKISDNFCRWKDKSPCDALSQIYDYDSKNLLIDTIPLVYDAIWDIWLLKPEYYKDKWYILYSIWWWDVCWYWSTYNKYVIWSKKLYRYSIGGWGCNIITDSINSYNSKNSLDFIGWFPKNNLKNVYSVFAISMYWDGNYDFRKNYIYNSSLNVDINEDQFYENKNNYKIKLWKKDFYINFWSLKDTKIKMPLLTDNETIIKNLYLTKSSNTFTVNMSEDNSYNWKQVKYIWIISCKSNYSYIYDKEYILKWKSSDWIYKYNISEKFNNKCYNPYKVNVYYTDWTKDVWEYYVLFDY